jgi:hypothetical protein
MLVRLLMTVGVGCLGDEGSMGGDSQGLFVAHSIGGEDTVGEESAIVGEAEGVAVWSWCRWQRCV